MNTRSQCQTGQAAPRPPAILHRSRQAMALLRVLGLCINSVACAQSEAPQAAAPAVQAVTPEQKFAPGYLEAVATGYDNGLALREPEGLAPLRQPREARSVPAAGAVPVAMPAAVRPQPAR
ncbi:hypothetical protein JJQ59_20805 [Cupriavidus necator]|uniref:Uncharacterized protein n=1 Tax=Cupriavidus necator TaxID=106590 RepID=A0A367PF93_CUPNE|nr:hypothetical protein [Cupriavidus necator]QQX87862.1 hypothetical protein JJQ59_20805 [Cupriavidus necator]RCJ06203.1 hypothetical protein DDK22_22720 [Cupriavidus necator]